MVYAKIDPNNIKYFDKSIRDAVIPMLTEKFERNGRSIRYNRITERLITAMQKLPPDIRYPNVEALFNAITNAQPSIDIELTVFWQRVSKSQERFSREVYDEYQKHIVAGYEPTDHSMARKREIKCGLVLNALGEMQGNFSDPAELYLSLPREVLARVPFSTFCKYIREGGEISEKAGAFVGDFKITDGYRHKMVPIVRERMRQRV
jgi:hypothetical protein